MRKSMLKSSFENAINISLSDINEYLLYLMAYSSELNDEVAIELAKSGHENIQLALLNNNSYAVTEVVLQSILSATRTVKVALHVLLSPAATRLIFHYAIRKEYEKPASLKEVNDHPTLGVYIHTTEKFRYALENCLFSNNYSDQDIELIFNLVSNIPLYRYNSKYPMLAKLLLVNFTNNMDVLSQILDIQAKNEQDIALQEVAHFRLRYPQMNFFEMLF